VFIQTHTKRKDSSYAILIKLKISSLTTIYHNFIKIHFLFKNVYVKDKNYIIFLIRNNLNKTIQFDKNSIFLSNQLIIINN